MFRDAPLTKFTYRGLVWGFLRGGEKVFVRAYLRGVPAATRLINRVIDHNGRSDAQIAKELAVEAIVRTDAGELVGVDGVPFIIHMIEDEAAREAAVEAFKKESGA